MLCSHQNVVIHDVSISPSFLPSVLENTPSVLGYSDITHFPLVHSSHPSLVSRREINVDNSCHRTFCLRHDRGSAFGAVAYHAGNACLHGFGAMLTCDCSRTRYSRSRPRFRVELHGSGAVDGECRTYKKPQDFSGWRISTSVDARTSSCGVHGLHPSSQRRKTKCRD